MLERASGRAVTTARVRLGERGVHDDHLHERLARLAAERRARLFCASGVPVRIAYAAAERQMRLFCASGVPGRIAYVAAERRVRLL